VIGRFHSLQGFAAGTTIPLSERSAYAAAKYQQIQKILDFGLALTETHDRAPGPPTRLSLPEHLPRS